MKLTYQKALIIFNTANGHCHVQRETLSSIDVGGRTTGDNWELSNRKRPFINCKHIQAQNMEHTIREGKVEVPFKLHHRNFLIKNGIC